MKDKIINLLFYLFIGVCITTIIVIALICPDERIAMFIFMVALAAFSWPIIKRL